MRKITFFLFLFSLSVLNAQSITPPFSDDFADFSLTSNGWSRAKGPLNSPTSNTSTWAVANFANMGAGTGSRGREINIFDKIEDSFISPAFDLSGGAYTLSVDIAWNEYGSTAAAVLDSDDYVALFISNDGGTTWVENQRWDNSTTVSATGETITVPLTGYSNNVKIAFYAYSQDDDTGGGTADTDFSIDNFSIVADATASVKEADKFVKSVFPNPVSDELFISTKKDITSLTLYDIRGAQVMSKKVNAMSTSINVAKLDRGVYILKLDINGSIATKRVVVK